MNDEEYGDCVKCPACGAEDIDLCDYPRDRFKDGHVDTEECSECGVKLRIVSELTLRFTTTVIVPTGEEEDSK